MVSPAGLFCISGPVNSCHPPCGMGVLDEKGAGTRGSTSARPARLACSYRARRRTRQDDPRPPAVRPLGPAPPSTRLIVGSRECESPCRRAASNRVSTLHTPVRPASATVTAEKVQIRSRNASYNTPVTRHPIATRGRPRLVSLSRGWRSHFCDRPLPGFNSRSPEPLTLHVLMYDWGCARSSAGRRISTR